MRPPQPVVLWVGLLAPRSSSDCRVPGPLFLLQGHALRVWEVAGCRGRRVPGSRIGLRAQGFFPRLFFSQYRHHRRHREGQGLVQGAPGVNSGLQHLPAQGGAAASPTAPVLLSAAHLPFAQQVWQCLHAIANCGLQHMPYQWRHRQALDADQACLPLLRPCPAVQGYEIRLDDVPPNVRSWEPPVSDC